MGTRARTVLEDDTPPSRARLASSERIGRARGPELIRRVARDAAELAFAARGVGTAQRCLEIAARHLASHAALVRHGNAARVFELVVATSGDAAEYLMRRHRGAGTMLTGDVISAPIVFGGARLGMIEIADAVDGEPFDQDDQVAIELLAERYAQYVVMGGLVTDAAEIARFAVEERTWRALRPRRIGLR